MPHWKSIHIERFRRLENLRLDDLGTVNLLVGKNNSGKTSVLEALAIMGDPFSVYNWIDTAWERELKSARTPVLEVLNWIFPHTSPRQNGFESSAVINGTLCSGERLEMEASYREYREVSMQPPALDSDDQGSEGPGEYVAQMQVQRTRFPQVGQPCPVELEKFEFGSGKFNAEPSKPALMPHVLVTPVSHRTSRQLLAAVDQVLADRLKDDVIQLLKIFADDVDDFEIRSPQGQGAVIHLHHAKVGHVPLSVEGDGMRRALAFASAAARAKNGVLLVDEVETALHPDALASIFRFLVKVCRASGVQLFVSTHSLEAVDAIIKSVEGIEADLVAYRLPARGSQFPIKRFGSQTLHDLRYEGGLDIR